MPMTDRFVEAVLRGTGDVITLRGPTIHGGSGTPEQAALGGQPHRGSGDTDYAQPE